MLVTPVLLLLLLFVTYAGRLADAQLEVQGAAHQAARATTLARDPASATAEAEATARAALDSCARLAVAADTADYRPGGWVAVVLTCHVDNSDLAGLGVPGQRAVTATATSVLDTWRGVEDPDGAP